MLRRPSLVRATIVADAIADRDCDAVLDRDNLAGHSIRAANASSAIAAEMRSSMVETTDKLLTPFGTVKREVARQNAATSRGKQRA